MTWCCLYTKVMNNFRGILICAIFRPRDMQECYMLFWIFARDNLQYIPFLLNWCSWMTTFSNLKTYLPSVLKHLFGCHFKHLWKKRNIIVTFQSGQLTEQPKTLFNSTEWCYIKRTIDSVLQILLQASRWRVKTANTI
jgi:hypothetical protein